MMPTDPIGKGFGYGVLYIVSGMVDCCDYRGLD